MFLYINLKIGKFTIVKFVSQNLNVNGKRKSTMLFMNTGGFFNIRYSKSMNNEHVWNF